VLQHLLNVHVQLANESGLKKNKFRSQCSPTTEKSLPLVWSRQLPKQKLFLSNRIVRINKRKKFAAPYDSCRYSLNFLLIFSRLIYFSFTSCDIAEIHRRMVFFESNFLVIRPPKYSFTFSDSVSQLLTLFSILKLVATRSSETSVTTRPHTAPFTRKLQPVFISGACRW
jgi:hypothetical protein